MIFEIFKLNFFVDQELKMCLYLKLFVNFRCLNVLQAINLLGLAGDTKRLSFFISKRIRIYLTLFSGLHTEF